MLGYYICRNHIKTHEEAVQVIKQNPKSSLIKVDTTDTRIRLIW